MSKIIINGPVGRIEARYHHSNKPKAPIALILHHHPEYGGSMNNKVTYALFKSFSDIGFNTLRFNFRGVEKSEGRFGNGDGELADATSVLDWLQNKSPSNTNRWVAGFSFGAWIGMQLLMRRPEINGFVSISPPANIYDFSFLAPCPVSGLIIQGDKDNIVTKGSVDKLNSKLNLQKNIKIEYQTMKNTGHFYQGKLSTLMKLIKTYLLKNAFKQI